MADDDKQEQGQRVKAGGFKGAGRMFLPEPPAETKPDKPEPKAKPTTAQQKRGNQK